MFFSFVCPVGRFFLTPHSEAEEKTDHRETKRNDGGRGGRTERRARQVPKGLYRLARSRAVPKGRPGAKRSGHTRPWEWRNGARPSASERLLLPCRVRQLIRQRTVQGPRYISPFGFASGLKFSARWGQVDLKWPTSEKPVCTKPLERRTLSRARRKQSGRFQTFQTGEA